jgi:hypothetical protein
MNVWRNLLFRTLRQVTRAFPLINVPGTSHDLANLLSINSNIADGMRERIAMHAKFFRGLA